MAIAPLAVAQIPSNEDGGLRERVLPLVTAHRGQVVVAIEHLTTGDSFRFNADVVMPTASLIKLPLMVAAYHAAEYGGLDLEKPIVLLDADKVPGSGILTDHISAGAILPLRDYVRLMIRDSDNTATNVVIDQVGIAATTQRMESLQLPSTKLHSKVYRGDTSIDVQRSREFGIGSTTANEMVTLLRLLSEQKLANPSNTKQMLDHLASCTDRQMLARYLSPETKFFHKTGAISNCRTEAGIIETSSGLVAVCVLTNKNTDQSWGQNNEAELLCSEIGRIVVDRYGRVEPDSTMHQGSTGSLVESLQRTLNERLDPSPGLTVDGEFGPGTEGAVKRFQRIQGMEPTGVIDPDVWKALGLFVDQVDETSSN